MFKKLLIICVIFIIFTIIIGIYYERILNRIDDYAYEHQDSDWAPKVEFTIGNFYYFMRKYDKATEVYEWLLTFYKNKKFDLRGDVQYMLGRCYERQGEISKAESIYREVINRYPETDAAKGAHRRLMENVDLEPL